MYQTLRLTRGLRSPVTFSWLQITAQFAKEYEEKTGQPVKFRLSFGGSGTQARAVVDGLPGDIGVSAAESCPVCRHAAASCLHSTLQHFNTQLYKVHFSAALQWLHAVSCVVAVGNGSHH